VAGLLKLRAFTVHVFTACGAALALLALILATGGHWAGMFVCLGLALIVDGVDGPMARAFEVKEMLPRWSGDTLDSQRLSAGRAGYSGRPHHRHHRGALFRRPRHEDRR
jgi:hypothetical protein